MGKSRNYFSSNISTLENSMESGIMKYQQPSKKCPWLGIEPVSPLWRWDALPIELNLDNPQQT